MIASAYIYGVGHTRQHAITDCRAQIAGALPAMCASMTARVRVFPVSAEHASDVAAMRDANAIAWPNIDRQDTKPAGDQNEGTRFLNFYDSPCSESWLNEDDCTCDDRCVRSCLVFI